MNLKSCFHPWMVEILDVQIQDVIMTYKLNVSESSLHTLEEDLFSQFETEIMIGASD